MASRPFESLSDLRLSGTGAGVLAVLAFLLGYGARGGDEVPATRPISTGDEAGISFALVWGVLITLAWAFRDQLRAALLGPQRQRLLLVALAFVPVIVADALAVQLAAATAVAHPVCSDEAAAAVPFADFPLRPAILGGTMLLVLLAWERHLLGQAPRFQPAPLPQYRGQPATGEWLDFPEAPLLRIRADDVVLIRSAGNYSEIVALGRAHLVRAPLGTLADRLADLGFVRVHRQTIINARNVRQICRDAAGRALIHLDCGQTVPVGRRYMTAIDALTR